MLKLTALTGALAGSAQATAGTFVYFGVSTRDSGTGIYLSTLDRETGALSAPKLAAEAVRPGFLALHPNGRFLYATGEQQGARNAPGVVRAFAIDRSTGGLTFLNEQSSRGENPCHVNIHPSGGHVFVANYNGGNAAVLPVGADGRLGPHTALVNYTGSSIHPQRQQKAFAHSVNLDPAATLLFVADLGSDRMMVHRFNAADGTLTPGDPPFNRISPGSGPRHFAFHPNGKFAYTLNELSNTVTVFAFDAQRGALKEIQTIPTLPRDWPGESTSAEIVVHPNGKYLYTSNRGHDSLASFAVDPAAGTLTPIGHTSSGGRTPRNFAIAPGGKWLLAANQDSNSVLVFAVDPASGALASRGAPVSVPNPTCVRFLVTN